MNPFSGLPDLFLRAAQIHTDLDVSAVYVGGDKFRYSAKVNDNGGVRIEINTLDASSLLKLISASLDYIEKPQEISRPLPVGEL